VTTHEFDDQTDHAPTIGEPLSDVLAIDLTTPMTPKNSTVQTETSLEAEMNDPEDSDGDHNSISTPNLVEPFEESEVVESARSINPQEEVGENDEDDFISDEVNNSTDQPAEGPTQQEADQEVDEELTTLQQDSIAANDQDSNLNEPFQEAEVVEHVEDITPHEQIGENDEDDQISDEVNNSSFTPAEGAVDETSDLSTAMNNVDATGPIVHPNNEKARNFQADNQQNELIEPLTTESQTDQAEILSTQAEENLDPEAEDALTDAFVRAALGPDVELDNNNQTTTKGDHESFDGVSTEIDLTSSTNQGKAKNSSVIEADQIHQMSDKELDDIVDAITIKITEEITISSGTNDDDEPDVTKYVTMNVEDVELGEQVLYNDDVYYIIGAESTDQGIMFKLEPKDHDDDQVIEVFADKIREIK
jgi:hypothetical protein